MKSTHDVCIVGGGVIGCAIAFFAARKGFRPLVIERNELGSQSTQAGAGMLGAQVEMEKPDALYRLGIASRDMYKDLQAELKEISGIDIELQTAGILRLAVSEDDRNQLLARQKWQTEEGQRAIWLEDEELRKEAGDLFGSTYGALYLPDDHQVRNQALLQALVASATKLGAKFVQHTEMTGIILQGDTVKGITTPHGQIAVDAVILAAGAWTGILSRHCGVELPVFPVKGQAIMAESRSPVTPFTVFTHGTYMLPKLTGHIYIGATMERCGFDKTPSLEGAARLLSRAAEIMPPLGKLGVHSHLVGLRPGSEDGYPFFGELPGIKGLYTATGHLRNGVLLAPITGAILADLLSEKVSGIDLAPFSVNRLL
ncbi:glycine oxidase ThiO [Effusibacillus lacus]|uniref:glycine oxidase n=1 Tax=Effusibacillus lacus TaxID=1348429 RepID=A0A292YN21_9BACL|nr:glycine oxidase ThiO [Effusibacillus lacus]TCS71268.1 glycine oxidase [Effusibacillus lacus]GAX89895.1 glycine oxidase ThiO [Effusibacillus lacus]